MARDLEKPILSGREDNISPEAASKTTEAQEAKNNFPESRKVGKVFEDDPRNKKIDGFVGSEQGKLFGILGPIGESIRTGKGWATNLVRALVFTSMMAAAGAILPGGRVEAAQGGRTYNMETLAKNTLNRLYNIKGKPSRAFRKLANKKVRMLVNNFAAQLKGESRIGPEDIQDALEYLNEITEQMHDLNKNGIVDPQEQKIWIDELKQSYGLQIFQDTLSKKGISSNLVSSALESLSRENQIAPFLKQILAMELSLRDMDSDMAENVVMDLVDAKLQKWKKEMLGLAVYKFRLPIDNKEKVSALKQLTDFIEQIEDYWRKSGKDYKSIGFELIKSYAARLKSALRSN